MRTDGVAPGQINGSTLTAAVPSPGGTGSQRSWIWPDAVTVRPVMTSISSPGNATTTSTAGSAGSGRSHSPSRSPGDKGDGAMARVISAGSASTGPVNQAAAAELSGGASTRATRP